MSSDCSFQITFDWAPSKPVVVEPSAGQISSDAGLLPFHQFDEQLGLTRQFAEALTDRRHQAYVDHGFLEMTRMRVYANGQGTNRRAVVTTRPGAPVMPAACYDEYADRGEGENRNKEMKCGFQADRLSDHRK